MAECGAWTQTRLNERSVRIMNQNSFLAVAASVLCILGATTGPGALVQDDEQFAVGKADAGRTRTGGMKDLFVGNLFADLGEELNDPLENRINDTPMTAIFRTIEIDLRQMLGEVDLPDPIEPEDGVLM